MSNQVAGAGASPPDFFKNSKPSQAFAVLDPQESLAEGIGASYAVVGYKGKIWSLRLRGENHLMLRPDDGTPIGYIDVIILRSAKNKAKSYYPDGFEDGSGAGKRPLCASIDSVRPDLDVQVKQAELCALCPRNEWKTDTNGRKGRDCADSKRLAVLLVPHQTARVLGQPLMEPAFLRVPPASLNALALFGENMAQQGWPFSSFVTRIQFDPAKAHPEFTFKALQALTDDEAKVILSMREEQVAKRITGEDEIARRALTAAPVTGQGPLNPGPAATGIQAGSFASPAAPAPVATAQPAVQHQPVVQQPAQQAPQPQETAVQALPNPGLGIFSGPPAPPQNVQTVGQATTANVIDLPAQGGGVFGMTPPQLEPNPTPQPGAMVGQTADDVGSTVEDENLDKMIEQMLAT